MRIAYIGHAYHERTGSTRFLIDLLREHASVEQWSGEPGDDARRGWGAQFDETRYDAIVVFQLHEAFDLLSGRHPNIVFVPMYDSSFWGGNFYWRRAFNAAKIACFSWALGRNVGRHTQAYANFQYYPDPEGHARVKDFDTLRGLLWDRKREISPATGLRSVAGHRVRALRGARLARPRQRSGRLLGRAAEQRLERTGWIPTAAPLPRCPSNVFFAPRLHEGIGISVLEAMASGHCVVAPDAPTNEYISNGTNGLLYAPGRHAPLDLSAARSLGARARESVERGHARWRASIPALLDFVATPTAQLRNAPRWWTPVPDAPGRAPPPSVTVVALCRAGTAACEATLEAARAQIGCDVACVTSENLAEAMRAAVAAAGGGWVLFISAGDRFIGNDALWRMLSRAPADAELVYGHHIRRFVDGTVDLVSAAEDLATTCDRLRRGEVGIDWLLSIPAAAATAVRSELLARLPLGVGTASACVADLLLRAQAQGVRLFNCDETVAVIEDTAQAQRKEWVALARRHGSEAAADRLDAALAGDRAPRMTSGAAWLGWLALASISAVNRCSPTLARAIERGIRGIAARPAVRRLRRRAEVSG